MTLAPTGSDEVATHGVCILRHVDVRKKLRVSPAKLFDMVAKGQFPKPFLIIPCGRAVGWLEDDVDAWICARKAEGSTR